MAAVPQSMPGTAPPGEPPDPRLDWIETRVCSSLEVKTEKFRVLLKTEEPRLMLDDFLDQVDSPRIFIFEDKQNDLQASRVPPSKIKKKVVYFVKLSSVVITKDNIAQELTYGEISENPLEQLSTLSQEVFLPLLCSSKNQVGWPEVIVKDVMDTMHKFIASVYVTIGQIKGKTLLPLPPSELDGEVDRTPRDKEKIHVLESAIVTWTRQIKNVLKTDPETILKEGSNPGPLAELEFWQEKAANLNSIYEQLSGERVRKELSYMPIHAQKEGER
ncbi:hypothetical protein CBR_g49347 [Chara braunii]|uniref:Dynein heavy chain tail domain-containing protein n=1 Tax=Chara braunii TaxID=69332 RepID=A0A388M4Q1_CHABU|nr:hypothetical protein CBR_g49347 [Chara braunii]|eukprot:GBG89558.1 hypothetical protein CBR_g49347 [Chara braunii]